ncbi:hypothetical protein HHK36_023968 [Tetracentron sinense]|uniref:SAM domain-containing protein n=1 Tax=Tetracentron sinense TaxID=13715 RepID=A0A834YR61_TETSI|nr:hypothetical protein HHK36_023968 [Tetracentron sinense]
MKKKRLPEPLDFFIWTVEVHRRGYEFIAYIPLADGVKWEGNSGLLLLEISVIVVLLSLWRRKPEWRKACNWLEYAVDDVGQSKQNGTYIVVAHKMTTSNADVGLWLEEINLGSYRQTFEDTGVNGEYLEGLSMFTTEQILRFIRRCHMKWGDFITLCKELRRIKCSLSLSLSLYIYIYIYIISAKEIFVSDNYQLDVGMSPFSLSDIGIWETPKVSVITNVACLKGEQEVRRPWWAPPCLSIVFVKVAKRNRQSRVVSLKLEP